MGVKDMTVYKSLNLQHQSPYSLRGQTSPVLGSMMEVLTLRLKEELRLISLIGPMEVPPKI